MKKIMINNKKRAEVVHRCASIWKSAQIKRISKGVQGRSGATEIGILNTQIARGEKDDSGSSRPRGRHAAVSNRAS